MKAQELRIGNLVIREAADGIDDILPVCKIDDAGFIAVTMGSYSNSCILSRVKPVPLTEDWLLRAGFELMDNDGFWEHSSEPLFGFQVIENTGVVTYAPIWDGSFTGAPLQYLHQLQNLYFALTGTELTFKEL